MKTLLTVCSFFIMLHANAQLYAAIDGGPAYRFKPIESKGQPVTDDKKITCFLNANVLYKIHVETKKREGDLVLELNNHVPLIDNTNAFSTGLRIGMIIPVANNFELLPMAGAWLNIGSAAGTTVKPGFSIRAIVKMSDSQLYCNPSYINGIATLEVGVIVDWHDVDF